jgi:lipopolysaccharide biosynthesis glycosyltransferase
VVWVDASRFEIDASRGTHLTVATYFRLWVAHVVPATAERVLYLDVDVLVRHALEELWSVDLEGHAFAAVQSVHYPFVATRGAVNHWRDLDLDPRTPFFNAGVMMIDLSAWRELGVEDAALEYLRSPYLGSGADQEALNVAVRGVWTRLPPIWNQQTPMLTDDYGAHLVFSTDDIDAARTDPTIVHFQTRPKPWQTGSTHPWRNEWLQHARLVDFAPVEDLPLRSRRDEVTWRLRRAASAIVRGR